MAAGQDTLEARLDVVIDAALAERRIVGACVMAARGGRIIYRRAAGFADRESGVPVVDDTVFRLASVTKPIVAAAALAMIEDGLLSLDHAVSDLLPYFSPALPDGSRPQITIRHLLTHTAGLSYDYANFPGILDGLKDGDLTCEENLRALAGIPLAFEPGSAWRYSMALDVLGAVLAEVSGGTLDEVVSRHVTGPLGMERTGFLVERTGAPATAYCDGPHGAERMPAFHFMVNSSGEGYHFAPGRAYNPRAFQSGGAGLLGTAPDFMRFLLGLRDRRLLPDAAVREAMANQIGRVQMGHGYDGLRFGYLGAVVEDPRAAATPQAPGTVKWGGVYGNDWFFDPVNDVILVSMTNTALAGVEGRFPADLCAAVYAG